MSITPTPDGKSWNVSMPWVFSMEALENIAEGIECGEVEGSFVVKLPADTYWSLPASLRYRLGRFVVPEQPF